MHFFREIKDYVGFDETDADRLEDLHPVVEPHFDRIVEHFYDSLMANPRTRGVFEDEQQIDRLRGTLHEWLDEVFTGPYGDSYYQSRRKIGHVHVEVGLEPRFMFGAMNLVRSELMRILDDADRSIGDALSVGRILDLELTVMTQAYWDTLMEQKLEVPVALATGLAHEIRNPLNTLKLQMTLLRRRANELDDNAEETFEPIIESVENELQRIRGLTNDITDFAKPIQLDTGWHPIASLVDELEGAYRASLATLEIEFEIDYDPDDRIWCDVDRLNQALINLIQNAVQAIEGEGRIGIDIETDDEGARIFVDDTGEGIPADEKYAIFDMFHTTKASGTGLGLPIVRKIVDAHGGTIEVESDPGEGTTFTIYLPFP